MTKHVENPSCWVPVVQASLLGMAPFSQTSFPAPPSRKTDRRIVINVSGRRYETWENTLKRHPETLLGSEKKEIFYDKQKEEYFFQTDPYFFRHVLNYYRQGRLHFSLEECACAYKKELKFFGISTDNASLCCWEDLDEKIMAQSRSTKSGKEVSPKRHCTCDSGHKAQKHTLRQRLWSTFENPYDSNIGKAIYYVTGLAIVLSIIMTIAETVPCGNQSCGEANKSTFQVIDGTCVIILTIEFLVRLYAAPKRLPFLKSFQSFVDIAAVLPFYLDVFLESTGGVDALTTLRVFRVLRVVKMSGRSSKLRNLGSSIKNSSSELGFILFSFSLGVIIFSTIVYYCEKDVIDTTFKSIPDSMWYAIVTMTTLG